MWFIMMSWIAWLHGSVGACDNDGLAVYLLALEDGYHVVIESLDSQVWCELMTEMWF